MMSYVGRSWSVLRDFLQPVSFWIIVAAVATSPIWYTSLLNWPGPSTFYFDQNVASARHDEGLGYILPGDQLLMHASTVRHKFNGRCELAVWRVRENIGGKYDGNIHLMQFVWQAFVGENFFRKTSWPIAPARVIVDKTNVVQDQKTGEFTGADGTWFDDPSVQQQTVDVFVVGRYYCNFMDYIFPRFLEDNDGVTDPAFFGRDRALQNFSIPGWDIHSGLEGGHSRVILKRN